MSHTLWPGVPFHGEFSSADAHALSEPNSRFSLYGPESTSAITLDSNDEVIITDVIINNASAGTLLIQIYDGANNTVDAGETVLTAKVGTLATTGGVFQTGHHCQKGTYPKVITDTSGQVYVSIKGLIHRRP